METVKKWRREQHRMKVEIKEKNKIINKEAPFLQVPRSWFHYSGGPRAGIDANKRKKKRRRARQRGNRCAPLDSIIVLCAQRFSTFLSRPPFSTTFDANAVANCDHRQIRRLCPVTDNNHRNRQIHSIVTSPRISGRIVTWPATQVPPEGLEFKNLLNLCKWARTRRVLLK